MGLNEAQLKTLGNLVHLKQALVVHLQAWNIHSPSFCAWPQCLKCDVTHGMRSTFVAPFHGSHDKCYMAIGYFTSRDFQFEFPIHFWLQVG